MENVLTALTGQLVVSCQADPGSPLEDVIHIVALARAAVKGGAKAIRVQGVANVMAVRDAVTVPIIGIVKRDVAGSDVYITPEIADVDDLARAGADIIAFDATSRPRPVPVAELCAAVRGHGRVAMADISTVEEGKAALRSGADFVGTTLSGYTAYSPQSDEPDFELMRALKQADVPFVAEGRIWTPDEAEEALALGARFVVVGSAITRPDDITRRFVRHLADRSIDALRDQGGSR